MIYNISMYHILHEELFSWRVNGESMYIARRERAGPGDMSKNLFFSTFSWTHGTFPFLYMEPIQKHLKQPFYFQPSDLLKTWPPLCFNGQGLQGNSVIMGQTTTIVKPDIHFDLSHTPVKFHVCFLHSSGAITLTLTCHLFCICL